MLAYLKNTLLHQVQSSNMRHLLGILHVANTYPDVTHVLKNISSKKRDSLREKLERGSSATVEDPHGDEEDESFSVTVDIICNKGRTQFSFQDVLFFILFLRIPFVSGSLLSLHFLPLFLACLLPSLPLSPLHFSLAC